MTKPDSITKRCNACHEDLPLPAFHKLSTGKYGVQVKCRVCVKAYRRDYYLKRQVELCAYSNDYYQNNKEQSLKTAKKYAARNSARIARRYKRWREANKEKLRRDKQIDWILNKEHYAEIKRRYRAEHPEYGKLSGGRRRALLRGCKGKFTAKDLLAKCEFHGWRCIYCQTPVTPNTVHMDHRKPLSRGGANWIANIAPACEPCNLSKSKKTEAEFRAYLSLKLYLLPEITRGICRSPRGNSKPFE